MKFKILLLACLSFMSNSIFAQTSHVRKPHSDLSLGLEESIVSEVSKTLRNMDYIPTPLELGDIVRKNLKLAPISLHIVVVPTNGAVDLVTEKDANISHLEDIIWESPNYFTKWIGEINHVGLWLNRYRNAGVPVTTEEKRGVLLPKVGSSHHVLELSDNKKAIKFASPYDLESHLYSAKNKQELRKNPTAIQNQYARISEPGNKLAIDEHKGYVIGDQDLYFVIPEGISTENMSKSNSDTMIMSTDTMQLFNCWNGSSWREILKWRKNQNIGN
ncbi:hypothetical protein JQC92_14115 [Shewanella sp. 202IG2-18]|uniref:hypothetical protein n=1 Tax=Parashewanella hymeniacidonis TaxID=2807618 RepID=UPI00196063C4|nr:hypothetical protein [Parashewanella hymeniacidonis]MBM7073147.1 hypothetical protein [Parashewanella hymeniacidonis]